jgi:hypothetical protein
MRLADLRTRLGTTACVVVLIMCARAARADQPSSGSPVDLVRQTVQNEVAASSGNTRLMFTDLKKTPHGSQTRLMVETREGMAAMAVAFNDQPLTPEQRGAEEDRLAELVNSPGQLKKKQKSEKEDAERVTRIVKALPDAFLFEPDGTEVGTPEIGGASATLVRLKFRPNPKYIAPSHVEQVLTGMQGYLLIDADEHRIAKIDGTLNKEVGFGWGILGHLDQGGHFLVQQAKVTKGEWEMTRMSLNFTGKALLFKSINIKSDEVFSDFRAVPSNLTFAEGVSLLKKEEAELAENRQQPGTGKPK